MAQAKDQPKGVPDRTRDGPQEALPRDVDDGDGRHAKPEPPTATVILRDQPQRIKPASWRPRTARRADAAPGGAGEGGVRSRAGIVSGRAGGQRG
jgi:hypothetical protein